MTSMITTCFDCEVKVPTAQGMCHTCYERMRRRAIAADRWESVRVPKDAALEHIQTLRDMGYSINLIAHLGGLEERTLGRLIRSESAQIEVDTEDGILAVPAISLWELWKTTNHSHRMPSGPATRRVRALATDGWTYAQISDALGWQMTQVARLASKPSKYVLSGTTREVDEVFRSPEFLIPENQAHPSILRRKWPRSLEWDDIDDPDDAKFAYRRSALRVERILAKERV